MAGHHFAVYPFIKDFFTRLRERRERLGQRLAALESKVLRIRAGFLGLASDREALALALDDSALAARARKEAIGLRAREQEIDAAVRSRRAECDDLIPKVNAFIKQAETALDGARGVARSACPRPIERPRWMLMLRSLRRMARDRHILLRPGYLLIRPLIGSGFDRAKRRPKTLGAPGARDADRQVAALCRDLDRQVRELGTALADLTTARSPGHPHQPSSSRPSSVLQRLTAVHRRLAALLSRGRAGS